MPQTILVGAKDPNIAYLLQRYAEESGFQPSHVSQDEDLLGLAGQLQPYLVILDIELVETTDGELVRRLKAEPVTCQIPIVIYSCLDEPPEDWHEGVDGYLLKSIRYDDFVAVLERAGSRQCASDTRPQ